MYNLYGFSSAGTKISAMPKHKSSKPRPVPFARGFKRRSYEECHQALGYKPGDTLPKEYNFTFKNDQSKRQKTTPDMKVDSGSIFSPIPDPTSQDDWLAQYNEDGQTYKQFLEENPWMFTRKIKYTKQTFCGTGKTIKDKYPDYDDPAAYQFQFDRFKSKVLAPLAKLPPAKHGSK